ncbi:MAG: hypothetical protein PHP54_03890 [Clostridia bacterium]|nr:hypothetical protein [Clostridia bacterium]
MTILIVESDSFRQQMIASPVAIFRKDIDIVLTESLEAAIEEVETSRENFSAIILNPAIKSTDGSFGTGLIFLDFLNKNKFKIPVLIYAENASAYVFEKYPFVYKDQITRGVHIDTYLKAFLPETCPKQIPNHYMELVATYKKFYKNV